ncbi:hypothetical protein QQ045_012839 [Rhodiola kirilowii]
MPIFHRKRLVRIKLQSWQQGVNENWWIKNSGVCLCLLELGLLAELSRLSPLRWAGVTARPRAAESRDEDISSKDRPARVKDSTDNVFAAVTVVYNLQLTNFANVGHWSVTKVLSIVIKMISPEIVDLTIDDDHAEVNIKAVKSESGRLVQIKNEVISGQLGAIKKEKCIKHNQSSTTLAASGQSTDSALEPAPSPADDTSLGSSSARCPAPICRQFWKAGNYSDRITPNATLHNENNGIHIHPMFLHSNATSHTWAFGGMRSPFSLMIPQSQNGATYVFIDKILNPRDGSPAFLVRDDGGGMDPEAMGRCMSFGFSEKKSGIGQYGNGFKTSTMRLGADVVVFSRHLNNGLLTQSVGLLSYTFLTQMGHNRIVVPMVTYEFNVKNKVLEPQNRYGKENFKLNLSVLLQWSPYSTEAELCSQFNDIGYHGTKVIVYNLWHDDDGKLELDFDVDPEDIVLGGVTKKIHTTNAWKGKNEAHVSNRLQHSLRAYLSILYMRLPEIFRIVLRGKDVEHYNIAADLKHPQFIVYKPHSAGHLEATVLTSIGFVKDAPEVMVHGFNVYHKNRLILPFWKVNGRIRGVVGVLEANFIEPTHNKQDFERTSLFQKLELRLRQMTGEYWDLHSHLIGYRLRSNLVKEKAMKDSLQASQTICNPARPTVVSLKRTGEDIYDQNAKRQRPGAGSVNVVNPNREILETKSVNASSSRQRNPEIVTLLLEREKLQTLRLEFETEEKELSSKVEELRSKLIQVQREYQQLQAEANSLAIVKEEAPKYICTV